MFGALVVLLAGVGLPSAAGKTSGTSRPAAATNGRVVFVLGQSPGKCKGGFGNLATANPDGSQCRVLATGDTEFPALNPAGNTIAFTRVQPPASPIYIIGANGKGERKLIDGPAYEPTWSPDGSRIAFMRQQSGTSQIYVANAHTGAILAQLTTGPGDNTYPAWSPDGKQIAFISDRAGPNRLYVMQANGADQSPLTEDAGDDFDPAWSPNSRMIAFANDQLVAGTFQIYEVNRDGTAEARVTNDALNDQAPSWSPDGRLIAFTSFSTSGNTIGLAPAPGTSLAGPFPTFPGEQPNWARLPAPSTPVPGVTVNATPHGKVEIQPGGSSLAVPLNGSVSVSVTAAAPTIFRPGPGGSVTLQTRLKGGRSSTINVSEGAVSLSQPAGRATQIVLMGTVSNPCTASKKAAKPVGLVRWRIQDRGSASPRAVKGYVTVYFQGTAALIEDVCQPSPGMQQLNVIRLSGNVTVTGIGTKPIKPNGNSCGGDAADRVSRGLASRAVASKTLQLLHASAHGKFCTRGRYSAATVRG